MEIKKATEITDAKIQFVSLVDRAANKKGFLITKAQGDTATFTAHGRILKTDTDTHYITGIVYEPMKEDAHGDFMSAEEIQKASNYFMKNSGSIDLQHNFEVAEGVALVENYIAPTDLEFVIPSSEGGHDRIGGEAVMNPNISGQTETL